MTNDQILGAAMVIGLASIAVGITITFGVGVAMIVVGTLLLGGAVYGRTRGSVSAVSQSGDLE